MTDIDVLILCGGLGTRLSKVINDTPKGMAKVGGKPFLSILVNELSKFGMQNIIFCIGHLREQISGYFCSVDKSGYRFSAEEQPLGTGGALKNAELLVKSDPFLVLNGDSICEIDYYSLLDFHLDKKAMVSIVLSKSNKTDDYGSIELDENQTIISFQEKKSLAGGGLINAGVYLMNKEFLSTMKKNYPLSLEREVFPEALRTKRCVGYVVEADVMDIGTPERYRKANESLLS